MSDSEIESFSALMDLSRTATINLTDNQWPDKNFDKKWNSFIDYLKSFSDEENGLAEITDRKLQLLQKLLDLFFASEEKDISIIRSGSKKNIPQILYSLNRLVVDDKPLSDRENLTNFILLLNKIPESDYIKIAVPLLKYYLRSTKPEEELNPIIVKVFSTFNSSLAVYEKDIDLYVNYDHLASKLRQSVKGTTLDEVLVRVGVSERYVTTTYMKSLFFLWFFSQSHYDQELLEKNKTNIDECTSDEKKLLLASIINSTYLRSSISDKDIFIRTTDEKYFPTPTIDKTEDEYWTLVTSDLDTQNNINLLHSAHKYYVNIFTRFIITKFFDSLSDIASDRNGQARANYWRRYGTSDAFEDIKLVINSWQRRRVFAGLTSSEAKKFSKHVIVNSSDGYSESPVFIIVFKTKTVAIFLQTGHSAQVFNTDNPTIRNILHSSYVYSSKALSIYTAGSLYNSYDRQGRVIQNGYWQYNFTHFLSRNGITQGKE